MMRKLKLGNAYKTIALINVRKLDLWSSPIKLQGASFLSRLGQIDIGPWIAYPSLAIENLSQSVIMHLWILKNPICSS